jgi:hypothetical protein
VGRPAAPTPRPAALRALLATHGGFTIDQDTGRPIDAGIAVCVDPAAGLGFRFAHWSDTAVRTWLGRIVAATKPGAHLGGWIDDDRVCWLDEVIVFPAEAEAHAVEAAQAAGQAAVFDLGRRQLVPVTMCPVGR